MKNNNDFNTEVAARRLLRCCSSVSNQLFDMTIWWCRIGKDRNPVINMHKHFFFEIHYILNCEGAICELGGKKKTIPTGRFVIIPPTVMHEISSNDNMYKFVLGFEIKFNKEHQDYKKFKSLFEGIRTIEIFEGNEQLINIIDKMLETAYYCRIGYQLSLSSYLQLFIVEIANILNTNPIYNFTEKNYHGNSSIPIESIMKFLSDNANLNLTTNEVAKQFNISSRQLNRIVQKAVEKTVYVLINETKITYIKKLLLETDMSLHEIAMQCGYSSEYSLSRFFNKSVGWTPAAFRRNRE